VSDVALAYTEPEFVDPHRTLFRDDNVRANWRDRYRAAEEDTQYVGGYLK
jgi:hypothetical protein